MKNASTSGKTTRSSRRLAVAAVREGLMAWLAANERGVAELEARIEATPISRRRGAWLERTIPVWIERERANTAGIRRRYGLVLVFMGELKRLVATQARVEAAYARLLARVAEERAKGWPLKTLYDATPEEARDVG